MLTICSYPASGFIARVGSASDCKSRCREFELGHITFVEIDQNYSCYNIYDHSPPSADCQFINTGESMCTQYWLTAQEV